MSGMSMNREGELSKNTVIITIGRVSTQFVSFLLLPLYTRLLSKEEYGTVDLALTIVQLLIPVVSLMIDQGVFRYLLNCEDDNDRSIIISSAFIVLTMTCSAVLLIDTFLLIFCNKSYVLWMFLILIATSYSNFFLQIARGIKKTVYYSFGSFMCSASTIVLNVIFITSLEMGANGMLTASFLGNIICVVFLLRSLNIFHNIRLRYFDKATLFAEIEYAAPLIPNQLSVWMMNSSDRIIVTIFLGVAVNGILAISHKFSTIYLTFFNIFLLAWHETGVVHYFDEDRDEFFTTIIKKVVSIFATLCMAIIVALPIVFNWLINGNYKEAYYNIPIYLIASLFNVIVGLLGVVYVATKNTAEIAKTTMLAAVINIMANLCLIKVVGLYAASISTLIGYGITMVFRVLDTKKYLKIKYDVKQYIVIGIALAICSYIYYLDNKIISIIFLPFFLIVAYFLNRETVNGIIKIIARKIEGKINKKLYLTIIVVIVAGIIVAGGLYVYEKIIITPKSIQNEFEEVKEVKAEDTISFSSIGLEDFTCTGMTYDSKDDTFWICDYGAMNADEQARPRIIELDKSLGVIIRIVELSGVLDSSANLQGIAYDRDLDCLWLAVGNTVVALNKEGAKIGSIDLGKYSAFKSNGICYEENDNSLWILCASSYLLHYDKNGTVLGEYSFNYSDQDHICTDGSSLYITVGVDYRGTNNYVCKVSPQDGNALALYRVLGANALEGICCVDGKILIANDGLYHSDLTGHSYITIFNAEDFLQ